MVCICLAMPGGRQPAGQGVAARSLPAAWPQREGRDERRLWAGGLKSTSLPGRRSLGCRWARGTTKQSLTLQGLLFTYWLFCLLVKGEKEQRHGMVLGWKRQGNGWREREPEEGQIRRMRPDAGSCLECRAKTPC